MDRLGPIFGVSLLLLISSQANAALLERDLFTAGDGLLTYDSDTGFEWLDITATVGLSYSEALASQYVTSMSFRFANQEELAQLYDDAGGSGDYLIPRNSNGDFNGVPVTEHYNSAMLLISLLGCTSYIVGQACDYDDQDWHIGYYGAQVVGGTQSAAAVNAFNNSPTYGNAGAIWLDAAESIPNRTTADFGSYLVRVSPVPIPATVWLFGTAMIGLLRFSKRKSLP